MQRNKHRLLPLTKWESGDNAVFVFFSAYPPSVSNIREYTITHKYTIIADKQLPKKQRGPFEQRSAHQERFLTCVADQNDSRAIYIASSKSCQANGNFFGVLFQQS